MVAFVLSLIIGVIGVAVIFPYRKRRPVGTTLTWGEAMVSATYVFFLFFWVYGVVPHLWLTWADNELGWRPDKLLLGPGDDPQAAELGGWIPITHHLPGPPRPHRRGHLRGVPRHQHLAVVVVAEPGQEGRGRGGRPAVVESDFGRPLVRKA